MFSLTYKYSHKITILKRKKMESNKKIKISILKIQLKFVVLKRLLKKKKYFRILGKTRGVYCIDLSM